MYFPLLPVALALAAGIVVGGVCLSVWWVLLPVAVSVGAFFLHRVPAALVGTAFAIGMMLILLQMRPLPPSVGSEREARWSGVITELRELDGVVSLIVTVDSVDGRECAPFRSIITEPGFATDLSEWDRVGFEGTLRPLESQSVVPDQIDRASRLISRGVEAEGFLPPSDILYSFPEPGWLNGLRRLRGDLQRLIVSLPLTPATQNFLIATLTGDRRFLDPDSRQVYISGGIAHILALSGLHVAIIMACIMLVLIPLRVWQLHGLMRLATILLLWAFAVLTGLSPSVVRAVIMATVWLASLQLQRRHSSLNSLSFAAIVLMVADPLVIYTPGFQLSFAAVAGVVLLARPLNPVRSPRSPFRWIGAAVAMSVTAIIATGIVSAYWFNIFPVYFLLANLPVGFLLPLLLGAGVVLILFKAMGIDLPWLCSVADGLQSAIDYTASAVGRLPGATLNNVWVEPREVWLYFAVVILLGAGIMLKRRLLTASTLTLALLTVAAHYLLPPKFPASELYLSSSRSETSLLLRSGPDLRLYSTLRGDRFDELLARDSVLYSRYMLRRGVRSFKPLVEDDTLFPVRRSGDLIVTREGSFLFVSTSTVDSCRPDYLVVCRGFRGDILDLVSLTRPREVILSGDLNRRRHDRYLRELTAGAVPVRSLRSEPLVIIRDE